MFKAINKEGTLFFDMLTPDVIVMNEMQRAVIGALPVYEILLDFNVGSLSPEVVQIKAQLTRNDALEYLKDIESQNANFHLIDGNSLINLKRVKGVAISENKMPSAALAGVLTTVYAVSWFFPQGLVPEHKMFETREKALEYLVKLTSRNNGLEENSGAAFEFDFENSHNMVRIKTDEPKKSIIIGGNKH